jgi:hypothetical protein
LIQIGAYTIVRRVRRICLYFQFEMEGLFLFPVGDFAEKLLLAAGWSDRNWVELTKSYLAEIGDGTVEQQPKMPHEIQ